MPCSEPEYVQVHARRYRVTARFTDVDAANAHLQVHDDEGVICESAPFIFLAKLSDTGELVRMGAA